jgi:hypothetical protein
MLKATMAAFKLTAGVIAFAGPLLSLEPMKELNAASSSHLY